MPACGACRLKFAIWQKCIIFLVCVEGLARRNWGLCSCRSQTSPHPHFPCIFFRIKADSGSMARQQLYWMFAAMRRLELRGVTPEQVCAGVWVGAWLGHRSSRPTAAQPPPLDLHPHPHPQLRASTNFLVKCCTQPTLIPPKHTHAQASLPYLMPSFTTAARVDQCPSERPPSAPTPISAQTHTPTPASPHHLPPYCSCARPPISW